MMRRSIVGGTVAAVVLSLAPILATPADAAVRTCSTTSHGKRCANLHKPGKSTKLGREGRRLAGWRTLSVPSGSRVTYRGYVRRNLDNRTTVRTVKSKTRRGVWHLYRVRIPAQCSPTRWDAATAHTVRPSVPTPSCVGHRWTVRGSLTSDTYGWNCYRDGSGSCGPDARPAADGCVTPSYGGYTMCPDGRVYVLDGQRHRAELDRR